jgi:hypothetical protein
MDFKPEKFKKGDMVRYRTAVLSSLGIVKEQKGSQVEVEWVLLPKGRIFGPPPQKCPIYFLVKVEKAD